MKPQQQNTPPSILRRKEVLHRTGMSNSAMYMRIKAGSFPKSFSLGGNLVGWLESDIDRWISDCAGKRNEC